jgi:hypothetical protein
MFERTATLDADALVGELARIYRWYNESPTKPFRVEMGPVLRELPVRLTTFAEWALRQDWGGARRRTPRTSDAMPAAECPPPLPMPRPPA